MNKILLIGNGTYEKYDQIRSVYKDIETMENIFLGLDYEVTKYKDITYEEMKQGLDKFKKKISNEETIIVYYSGHGFHKDGRNFILAKDSPNLPPEKVNSEYYDEFNFFDVENFTQLVQYNLNGNTLIIIDACRNEETRKFKPLKEAFTNTNTAWKLFSTTMGKTAYGSGLFVQAIEQVIYRYNHSVTDAFEAICYYMKNNYKKHEYEYQAPILIAGKNNFSITSNFNKKLEEQYYSDLINIFLQVKVECDNYNYPYTEVTINKIATDINNCISFPLDILKQKVRKVLKYIKDLGIMSLLIEENLRQINVFTDHFFLEGRFSNYYFPRILENGALYEFDSCWKYIYSNSEYMQNYSYKYGKVTCLNVGDNAGEPFFTLIINKNERKLTHYIDDYYQDDIEKIRKIYISLKDIFENKESMLISGEMQIDLLSFIHKLLNHHLQYSTRVCELVNLTQMDNTNFLCEKIEYEELISDLYVFEDFRRRVKNRKFDWIIIPLTVYHQCTFGESELNRLMEIENIAKENHISFIFYTDFLEKALFSNDITEQAEPFISYTINLELNSFDKHTYIESIKRKH